MKILASTLSLVVLIAISGACDQASPTAPRAAPAAPPGPDLRFTFTVSGVVRAMTPAGRVPLEGVRVHWSEMHLDATTNAAGFYSLDVPRGQSLLLASKEGYK